MYFEHGILVWRSLDGVPLSSPSAVGHAERRPWPSDGQLHQREGGRRGAAGSLRAQQAPAHRAVLRHAHREDTGNWLVCTHRNAIRCAHTHSARSKHVL